MVYEEFEPQVFGKLELVFVSGQTLLVLGQVAMVLVRSGNSGSKEPRGRFHPGTKSINFHLLKSLSYALLIVLFNPVKHL